MAITHKSIKDKVEIPKSGQSTSGKIKINATSTEESESTLGILKTRFPNELPSSFNITEIECARLQGRQDVIRFLEGYEEKQINQQKG